LADDGGPNATGHRDNSRTVSACAGGDSRTPADSRVAADRELVEKPSMTTKSHVAIDPNRLNRSSSIV
jgi:hypothetical protein